MARAVGERHSNKRTYQLTRYFLDIVTKEHIGCAMNGLTQRHGDKEAARRKGSRKGARTRRLREERAHAKARGQGGCAGIFKSEFGENEWMAGD
ncbi:hypothetical protein HMPREF9136_1061 [Prevotella dentalis DSM 3688]|uniref:Uncharacterized protein n=1 Tax=Prevotella dentalis (strain ATCC 49559 / DSM 3688 / JCM 13448 / NCTC 12043 / ES 2772) TaxID=908937 RepID=F9D2A2_PREDD|nr:hypothetical protein HMPREF9136_1061 [Prevotella dentalis DSM 3688]